jgi:hypothetical protein
MLDHAGTDRRARIGRMRKTSRTDIRRGMGGGFSVAACCLAFAASWESEALRKRSMEKRRCFEVSSWIGGDTGLSNGSGADMAGWLAEEDMPSLGGVTGGAGTTRVGPDSWTGERAAAEVAGGPEAEPGRECGWIVARELLLKLLVLLALLRSNTVCLRMSDSLAITPRRRRNGMMDDHMWVRMERGTVRHVGYVR